ncbi:ATP-dependent 6-phosphofructokinase [Candidatus Dojkabacteria bacterium]|nr:ATP-dependent 6-phosphofructokinase [Candidatus Dojkabacteria bacterium]
MSKKRIGVLNSGGDAPGLNAVIGAIVKTATEHDYECIGIFKGFEGLLSPVEYTQLNFKNTWEIIGKGGTILKSATRGRFPGKVGNGQKINIDSEVLKEAKDTIARLKLESLIVIGGDGTLFTASLLAESGVKIIGVPKTIDNDLNDTDKTFGFNTAVEIIVESVDRVRTTASSHDRVFFIETMGRHAGWLALFSGVAAEADLILLPEFEFSFEKIIEKMRLNRQLGKHYQIVIVAEGAQSKGSKVYKATLEKQENIFGGISAVVINEIGKITGDEFEMRNLVLGHIQRGGSPNAEDRILAQRYGEAAVLAAINADYGKMIGLEGNSIKLVDLKTAVEKIKLVGEDHYLVKSAKNLGISFGN